MSVREIKVISRGRKNFDQAIELLFLDDGWGGDCRIRSACGWADHHGALYLYSSIPIPRNGDKLINKFPTALNHS